MIGLYESYVMFLDMFLNLHFVYIFVLCVLTGFSLECCIRKMKSINRGALSHRLKKQRVRVQGTVRPCLQKNEGLYKTKLHFTNSWVYDLGPMAYLGLWPARVTGRIYNLGSMTFLLLLLYRQIAQITQITQITQISLHH